MLLHFVQNPSPVFVWCLFQFWYKFNLYWLRFYSGQLLLSKEDGLHDICHWIILIFFRYFFVLCLDFFILCGPSDKGQRAEFYAAKLFRQHDQMLLQVRDQNILTPILCYLLIPFPCKSKMSCHSTDHESWSPFWFNE